MKLDDAKKIETFLACELPLFKLEETISQFASETKLVLKRKIKRYCKKIAKA